MKELERQSLLADREAVKGILDSMSQADSLGRLSFKSRLAAIEQRIIELDAQVNTLGSVALLFGGGPVLGSRAIDTEFTSKVMQSFTDLVSKRVATHEIGRLASRGPIPMRTEVSLGITDMVRGSVGFILEETGRNLQAVDSAVKTAIDEVTRVVISTGAENVDDFESAVDELDSRLLVSLKDFFRALDDASASIRIIENDRDSQLDLPAVHRGRRRVDMIDIKEEESDQIVGELLGLLPDSKRFEMRLLGSGVVIKGAVAAAYAPRYLALIETPDQGPVGRVWRAKMKIRQVRERNKDPRNLYTLIGLLEQVKPTVPANEGGGAEK